MRQIYVVWATLALALLATNKSLACGYDWVGSCSSSVHLRINGTLDSFIVADCPSGFHFDGQFLGTLQTLSLANARAVTWESCQNNVSAVNLKYRVYEQNGQAGNFQNLSLDQDYFTILGPYTTRYRSKASNINLVSGLSVGKTYVLEVYLVADIDTIGDDFIPETTITKNNNGLNYRMTFIYGGPNAAPFVVIPTEVVQPNCHGDHNGTIGVSVWGDHTGLFYNWSNIPLNFFRQNNLAAGTYTVTVTGANYSTATSIALSEPPALAIQNAAIQPVSCGGGQGSVAVTPSGGTAPYRYLWSDGQTTATAYFSTAGQVSLSLKDAHDCVLAQAFTVPGAGSLQKNISAQFCAGSLYQYAGHVFYDAGVYNFSVPGNGGCDTLIHLELTAVDPAYLLNAMPSSVTVSCEHPIQQLCAQSDPNTTYQWWKDNIPATSTACLPITAGGNYVISATQAGCSAFKNISVVEHLVSPVVQAGGTVSYLMDCYTVDSTFIHLTVSSNSANPHYEWWLQGQLISTKDSLTIAFDGYPSNIQVPEVYVEDEFGCTSSKMPQILTTPYPIPPYIFTDMEPDLCLKATQMTIDVIGMQEPYTITLNDSITGTGDFLLQPGQYQIVATDPAGCTATTNVGVSPYLNISVLPSESQVFPTGGIYINYFGLNTTYLWEDGSDSFYLDELFAGNYCVTITDNEHGCALDTCLTVPGLTSGIRELGERRLQLSPNPVSAGRTLQLSVDLPDDETVEPITLFDAFGKKVWVQSGGNTATQEQKITLPEYLPAGLYTLVLQSAHTTFTGKLCIKR